MHRKNKGGCVLWSDSAKLVYQSWNQSSNESTNDKSTMTVVRGQMKGLQNVWLARCNNLNPLRQAILFDLYGFGRNKTASGF